MKRWILTLEGNDYKPLIYADTAEKARQYFSSENVTDIQPYTNMEYLKYIEEIKSKSELLAVQLRTDGTREWYKYVLPDGFARIRLYKDLDGEYYDIAEYQFMSNDSLIYPCTFTYSNPAKVYSLFFTMPLSCEVVSYRFYGHPKLAKPAELKGVKQSFSADYIPKKCSCPCFVAENDLWIKHRDFFSAQHIPIVLRNEAWIVFRNIKQAFIRNENYLSQTLVEMFSKTDFCKKHSIDYLDLINSDWQRFFEETARKYNTYIMKGK